MTISTEKTDTPNIYRDLHQRLITAGFTPGEKLKPETLRALYGCSANTIRDVLLRLSTVGLVSFEEQRGFRAQETSPEKRHDVARFRILLEQEGANLSIRNGDIMWEAQLSAAHHKLSHIETTIAKKGELDAYLPLWSAAEWEFHDTLISACQSPLLRATYRNIYDQFRQQMVAQERDFGSNYFQAIITEHQTILDAALDRDEPRCRDAIFEHMKRNFI